MFDFDNWMEIFSTIKKNKLRTFLTGFSVSWGIFMLIVLLAAGNGLKNGVMSNFGERAKNGFEIWARRTSMAHQGNSKNRQIKLDQKDFDMVDKQVRESRDVSARVASDQVASYNFESSDCSFDGVYPILQKIDGLKIISTTGRFINEVDMKERRKVAVINSRLKEILFKEEDPVGKTIVANNVGFKVIGVYKGQEWGDFKRAYIPFTTAQLLFNKGWGINSLSFTAVGLNTIEENEAFEKRLRQKFAVLHQFHPDDERAIGIDNTMEDYLQTMGIFNGINMFVLVVGLGTLIAGVVGVSNIMLITVRERTREFGIRKALGAKPAAILKSILMESVLITAAFGYIGMVAGIGLSEAVNFLMESANQAASSGNENGPNIFMNPTVDVGIAIGSTALLVMSGVIAGYFPARKAVKVSAVEAMRAE